MGTLKKTNIHYLYLAYFFLEWEIFQTKVVEKNRNKYFVFNKPFLKTVPLVK
jgi:hypothetical protein